jgi:hypothetical protein
MGDFIECLGHAHLQLLVCDTRQPTAGMPEWICLSRQNNVKAIKLGRDPKAADM